MNAELKVQRVQCEIHTSVVKTLYYSIHLYKKDQLMSVYGVYCFY